MTEWSDAEISRWLALAIGWPEGDVELFHEPSFEDLVVVRDDFYGWGFKGQRKFDYRDPAVIWPIAERFNAFPTLRHGRGWLSQIAPLCPAPGFYTDTAAKAVALAVIKAKEQT